MSGTTIRFDDAAAYDQGMGVWSQLAGQIFLDWVAPPPAQSWIDIGCGSGAFSDLLAQTCHPASIQGIDPSEPQVAFARTRRSWQNARFQTGDAMALPFADNDFDAAVMALVIFFVPKPAKGVAEMARVVRPGGTVAAYAWDMQGGGFPFRPVQDGLQTIGIAPLRPPSADASRIDAMLGLWTQAGLQAVETRQLTVQRVFENFDDFWHKSTGSGSLKPTLAAMPPEDFVRLQQIVRDGLKTDPQGRIVCEARANAVKGRVPE